MLIAHVMQELNNYLKLNSRPVDQDGEIVWSWFSPAFQEGNSYSRTRHHRESKNMGAKLKHLRAPQRPRQPGLEG